MPVLINELRNTIRSSPFDIVYSLHPLWRTGRLVCTHGIAVDVRLAFELVILHVEGAAVVAFYVLALAVCAGRGRGDADDGDEEFGDGDHDY